MQLVQRRFVVQGPVFEQPGHHPVEARGRERLEDVVERLGPDAVGGVSGVRGDEDRERRPRQAFEAGRAAGIGAGRNVEEQHVGHFGQGSQGSEGGASQRRGRNLRWPCGRAGRTWPKNLLTCETDLIRSLSGRRPPLRHQRAAAVARRWVASQSIAAASSVNQPMWALGEDWAGANGP